LVDGKNSFAITFKPGWIGVVAIYLAYAAVVARTLTMENIRPLLPQYLWLELVYIILYTFVLWKPNLPGWLMHPYFVLQSVLVLYILSLRPEFDFVVVLFLLLSYQASLFFTGWIRWTWVIILVILTGGSLIYYLGFLEGLALAPTTMAVEIVIPAYIIVNQEIETTRVESQLLLGELQDTHVQLRSYASQVDELAAIQERNRLARELHDTVSQLIFSITLTTRSAQLLLERDPGRVQEQLLRLKEMTADALSQLRSLITQLRPPQNS
jgi:signal transduction histidine kinase